MIEFVAALNPAYEHQCINQFQSNTVQISFLEIVVEEVQIREMMCASLSPLPHVVTVVVLSFKALAEALASQIQHLTNLTTLSQ